MKYLYKLLINLRQNKMFENTKESEASYTSEKSKKLFNG